MRAPPAAKARLACDWYRPAATIGTTNSCWREGARTYSPKRTLIARVLAKETLSSPSGALRARNSTVTRRNASSRTLCALDARYPLRCGRGHATSTVELSSGTLVAVQRVSIRLNLARCALTATTSAAPAQIG